ncbi:MAG: beta-lactamase family protein [Armatimonadetes bacterium]|nr:beta-lactamase family protein [Armatimonadota bacterium]MDW8027578.1 serine hydrolase domain-containing protein [Armatimonadota bacterium]
MRWWTESFKQKLEQIVQKAIEEGQTPGAVVCIGTDEKILYVSAFGKRREIPSPQPMKIDTIFDLASVTKVVATAPSICLLWQQGKLDIHDPVKRYLPEFSAGHKSEVTLLHLLTHTSGLPAFKNYLKMGLKGKHEAIIADICRTRLKAPPGKVFIYSDLGFILLGEIVKRVSRLELDEFCRRYIYSPLKMKWTRFNPPESWHNRCAATEWRDGQMTQGSAHDPNAYALNGVAGHAGLFSKAYDLARFCQMLLREGELNGIRVFEPEIIRAMRTNQCPVEGIQRGLGFDIQSPYSPQMKGEKFPVGVFGHTGYTGTSIAIDPFSKVFVVLLTNRVHPDDKRNIADLRKSVANLVASAIYQ